MEGMETERFIQEDEGDKTLMEKTEEREEEAEAQAEKAPEKPDDDLPPKPMTEQEKKCKGCPYAKGQPCVSASCYKDLEKWLQERRARTVRKMMKEGETANV